MTLCERPIPCTLCPAAESCQLDQERHAIWLVDHRLASIGRRILVLSNKGGVGKSTVACSLAVSLAGHGFRTGLLDADLSGPSQPALLGVEGARLRGSDAGVEPLEPVPGLKLASSAFFLQGEDDAVMWRDSYKFEFLMHLLGGVHWGQLDYLVVDMPPGTGGELIGLTELLGRVDGALIVTTPQKLAVLDARKAVTACREAGVPVLGVVENMSGMCCPHCGGDVEPFQTGGGEVAALSLGVPFLGRIPLDHRLLRRAEAGTMGTSAGDDSPGARAMAGLAERLVAVQV